MVDNATSCPACGAPMPSRSVSGVYACLYCGTRVNIEGQPVPEPETPVEPEPEANLPEILRSGETGETPEAPTNVREAIETLNEIPEARETVQTVVSTGKRWLVIALLASVGLCVLCVGVTVLFLIPMFR